MSVLTRALRVQKPPLLLRDNRERIISMNQEVALTDTKPFQDILTLGINIVWEHLVYGLLLQQLQETETNP